MTLLTTPHTIELESAAKYPVDAVGHKAHSLAALAAEGLPVPEGIVLTTPWVGEASDEGLRAELREILSRLDGPLAVRS